MKNNSVKNKILSLAIIGSGPAGLTSAIYAKRSNFHPIVFACEVVCGKVAKTLLIENYPGFATTTGAKLCVQLVEQVNYLKIEVVHQRVINLTKNEAGIFVIETKQQSYFFEKVIIATGAKERELPVEGVAHFHGRGVSYCSSCDGYFFKDLTIAVIGGGNSAVEESKILAKIAKKLIIINRDDHLNAEPMLVEQITKTANVQIIHHHTLMAAKGQQNLEFLVLKDLKTNQEKKLPTDGLFIYIGSVPNTQFLSFAKEGFLDENNYVLTNQNFETMITNLYAVGDVVSGNLQQYTTAMGSATIALKDIIGKGFKHQ